MGSEDRQEAAHVRRLLRVQFLSDRRRLSGKREVHQHELDLVHSYILKDDRNDLHSLMVLLSQQSNTQQSNIQRVIEHSS